MRALPLIIALLAGCAGGPVGWGGSHKVLHADADIITIQFDRMVESYEDVKAIADEHCGKPSRVANVNQSSSSFGMVKTYTFACDK